MHDDVKRFHMDGRTGDGNIVEERERLIHFLEGSMRDDGHVPMLDILPQFTLDYDRESETFGFALSVYGVPVEDGEQWQIAGVMDGKTILSSIQTDRPKPLPSSAPSK